MSTLTDTLRELAELLPERFRIDEMLLRNDGHEIAEIASVYFDGAWWDITNGPDETCRAIILHACLEECRERGWHYRLDSSVVHENGSPGYAAQVFVPHDRPHPHNVSIYNGAADSPAEAISNALLAAIKNERGGAETE